MERPFLDYYTSNAISPVSQNISNLKVHLNRRGALYRLLGMAPALLRGKSIVEFGTGSGFNAVHTLQLEPARLLLVDGNPFGLDNCRELLTNTLHDMPRFSVNLDYILADFMEFATSERFDVVLCEGFLPLQLDPCAMLRRLASFTKPGGIVVCTCIDAVSYLPDLVRRACGQALVDPALPLQEQAAQIAPVFRSHFETLPNMSRPLNDWILDNVLHPFVGKLMSMHDAITALDDSFDVLGASPHFITDWRWYKDMTGSQSGINALARRAWMRNLHNFIDFSVILEERPEEENACLHDAAERFVACCFPFYESRAPQLLEDMAESVMFIADSVAGIGAPARSTAQKLRDAAQALRQSAQGKFPPHFGAFSTLFGRSQQYLSFVRIR